MPIDKNEIQKYIFDPANPKECKSYNLLLRIAKKENYSFFSPEFLQYFFGEQILNEDFKNELWDIPDNYDSLTFNEKIELFTEQLTKDDLNDFLENIKIEKINTNKIDKYTFFDKLVSVQNINVPQNNQQQQIYKPRVDCELRKLNRENFKKYILDLIKFHDNAAYPNFSKLIDINLPIIMFSKNYFQVLDTIPNKASILITIEDNIDKFIDKEDNKNIKPIFLKRIEDVELLLNVLEKDLLKEKYKNTPKETISNIKSISIKDFFSIKELAMTSLENKKEIYILGENGDGKTLLLQAITAGLKGIEKDGQGQFREIKNTFELEIIDSLNNSYTSKDEIYKNLFAYGAMRNNTCSVKDDDTGYMSLFNNKVDLKSPVDWFRELYISEQKEEENVISVFQAQTLLGAMLNKDVEIEVESDNVIFKEKGADTPFDRLSAGYTGVITLFCDMLYRLSHNQPYITEIKEYEGIVLIDEIELHLHPKWKYDFMKNLRSVFPLIQFIVTTHSPTVILGASKEAVFYKIYKDIESGEVQISNQMDNEGYTNNSLLSSPLFDLKRITSRDYDKRVSGDDYIYEKIHKVVAKRIDEDINIDEDAILKLIDEELNKI